jgi:hypothetical protein
VTSEQEIILVRAKEDFVRETFNPQFQDQSTLRGWLENERGQVDNWRPRKTYLDPEFIDMNPESIVFFSDIKEVVGLIDIENEQEIIRVFDLLMEI